jgi:hypothetical protein
MRSSTVMDLPAKSSKFNSSTFCVPYSMSIDYLRTATVDTDSAALVPLTPFIAILVSLILKI